MQKMRTLLYDLAKYFYNWNEQNPSAILDSEMKMNFRSFHRAKNSWAKNVDRNPSARKNCWDENCTYFIEPGGICIHHEFASNFSELFGKWARTLVFGKIFPWCGKASFTYHSRHYSYRTFNILTGKHTNTHRSTLRCIPHRPTGSNRNHLSIWFHCLAIVRWIFQN